MEEVILSELKERVVTVENLEYVYSNVERAVAKGLDDVPEHVKQRKVQYDKVVAEVRNYLNFIKVGNFSRTVSEALKEAETREEQLKDEIESLEMQQRKKFVSPSREWIRLRLEKLRETLDKNTVASGLALKELLGPVGLEPIAEAESDFYQMLPTGEKKFKPYYMAHTKVQTLALLDRSVKGSNWLQRRREGDSNPRGPFDPNGFRDRPLQPLGHLSESDSTRLQGCCEGNSGLREPSRPGFPRLSGACRNELSCG